MSAENTKIEHTVTAISGDNKGCVWVAVESQGLFCYDLEEGKLRNYTLENFSFISTNVQSFVFDNSGTLWIGCYGDGLFYSKDRLQTLHPYVSPVDDQKTYANDVVTCLVKGAYNCLYVGSLKGGVKELNLTSNKLHDLLSEDENGESVFVVNCWLLLTMNCGLVQNRDSIFIIFEWVNMFTYAVRSTILILCPTMLFIPCVRIAKMVSGLDLILAV